MSTAIETIALPKTSNVYNNIQETIVDFSDVQPNDQVIVNSLKPLHVKNEDAVVSLVQLLSQSKIVGNLNYNISSTRALNANQHEVTLTFSLADRFAGHFVLLRGLFEFNNIKDVTVRADRANRTFNIAFNSNDAKGITAYVDSIFNGLVKEINFKNILRGVIRLEERIKREQAIAYETLRAAV